MATMYHFDEGNFEAEVLQSTLPVLVDFTAVWCAPCQMLAPIVEDLCNEWDGKVRVGKVDIDECPGITERYGVMGVPSLLLFKGGAPVDRLMGYMPKNRVLSQLKRHL
jgi:thioredoxin 1